MENFAPISHNYFGLALRLSAASMNAMVFGVTLIASTAEAAPDTVGTLLSGIREFEQLLSDRDADMWLEDVMVLTPGSVNGSGHWRMDRLSELSEAAESSTGQLTNIYGLEDGRLVIEGLTSEVAG